MHNTDTQVCDSVEKIAVIGLACRFPGAENIHQFWTNLERQINSISEIPTARLDSTHFYSPNSEEPGKSNSKWGGFISKVDQFDAQFFGISPREAARMDPQQRLLLELSWTCLEDAGHAPPDLCGSQTGVFIGASDFDYEELQVKSGNVVGQTLTGSHGSLLANRISYAFDFHGPSTVIETACSSSLVALHQAVSALKANECEMALVGGVNVICAPTGYIYLSKLGMLSPRGQCRTFDAEADGYVRGEGVGMILLKPLCKALQDRDRIYGIILGSAVNHGGKARTLTSPNVYAQSQVICAAHTRSGVTPNTISYIEAHGTATPLGDPIEVNGLKRAFSRSLRQSGMPQPRESYCGLGSVKTNIGHLEAAAGIAGVIKVLLALQHKKLPGLANFQQLNPRIELETSPFYILEQTREWDSLKTEEGEIVPRRAGVSSFGFGGTNAHLVLEEAPVVTWSKTEMERPLHLLTLSAKSELSLRKLAQQYEAYLQSQPEAVLGNICFTANTGRSHLEHRLAIVTTSSETLREQLQNFASSGESTSLLRGQVKSGQKLRIAFLFTGQGSQYIGMGRQLYETQPTFRQTLERCDEILRLYLDQSLLNLLYSKNEAFSAIHETVYTQPALFAIEYALAQLWQSWGIMPSAVMGHSVGEYVAACIAGVFSLEDSLKLIAYRGRLIQALPSGGAMAALMVSEEQARTLLKPYAKVASIAAINGPQSVVISGEGQAITAICAELDAQSIKTKMLQVSHAFHSPLMEPMLKEFEIVASDINYSLPSIPIVSNVTGQYANNDIITPQYWVRHVRQSVQFAASIQMLYQEGYEVFLEVGPKPILLGMGRQCLFDSERLWLPSLRPEHADWQQLIESLARLYVQGVIVDWDAFDQDYARCKVALPTYPFQQERYWLPSVLTQTSSTEADIHTPAETSLATNPIRVETQGACQSYNNYDKYHVNREIEGEFTQDVVATKIWRIITKISQLLEEKINLQHNLRDDLGFDSLMLAETRSAVLTAFPMLEDLPLKFLYVGVTVQELIEHVFANGKGVVSSLKGSQWSMREPNLEPKILKRFQSWTEQFYSRQIERLDKNWVHKAQEINVLVARIEQFQDDVILGELIQNVEHPFFYEHSVDHVPGLYLIEAVRQFATAATHLCYQVPRKQTVFVFDQLQVNFHSFAEVNQPLFVVMTVQDKVYIDSLLSHVKISTAVVQDENVITSAEVVASIYKVERYDQLRTIKKTPADRYQ